MSTNKIFIQFYQIKWEDEEIYIMHDIKSLLTRGLEIFYLSFESLGEFFHNNLYLILYNKKIIIYLFAKHFYQIKIRN